MFKAIKQLWSSSPRPPQSSLLGNLSSELQMATTVLLLEIIRADLRVMDSERMMVERVVGGAFRLFSEEAKKLLKKAEGVHDRKTVERFCRLIDTGFSLEQKRYLIVLLWSIALSDERLERNEDYLVRKIARLLSLNHIDVVDAKLKAEIERSDRWLQKK